MAVYRNIYQFSIVSQNGDDIDIFISKKNYAGVVQQRPLGRAPILKRERNGNILGTSLEIYAECKVDGEFSQLYTSSADEFRVEVYRNQVLQWTGFVSPELYSEPDIAPPYDVQIIATDGLGELKNALFSQDLLSLHNHLNNILEHTGLILPIGIVSSLSWDDQQVNHSPYTLLTDTGIDLSNRIDDSCYDVLQDILRSLNACITQQDGGWLLIRESDLYDNVEKLSPVPFGSVNKAEWWPISNLSSEIIPAKKRLTLVQENKYRENLLTPIYTGVAGGWDLTSGVFYDDIEKGYVITSSSDSISYAIDFRSYPLQTQLRLTLRARSISLDDARDEASKMSLTIMMAGMINRKSGVYYLTPDFLSDNDRTQMKWFDGDKLGFIRSWDAPRAPEGELAIQDIEIIIPLYNDGVDKYAAADQLTIKISNAPNSPYRLCIYDAILEADQQYPGVKVMADIANDARGESSEIKVAMATSSDPMLEATMYGRLNGDGGIVNIYTPANSASDLLSFLVRDYAMQVALPRMRYRGKLNVPSMAHPVIPMIFERDSTYYFLNTYSYDLLNDELEVELISIPNASVTIESETVTELPSAGSAPGSSSGSGSSGGGASGGSGGGSSTLAGLADVQVGNVKEGQYLVYKEGYWKAESVGESVVSEVNDALNSMRLASNAFKNQGLAYSYDSNMYYENASLDSTDFIRIGERIKGRMFLGGPEYPRYSIIFFDANKQIISRYTGDSGKAELQDFDLTWQIPADAEFIVATNYNEYREVSYILFDGYEYAREIEAINEKTQVIPSIINNLGDCVIGEAVAPVNDNLSFGIKCNAGKVKVSVSVQNGSISGDKRWFIYRYANGQFEGTALGSITPPNTSVVVDVPEGDDGVWLFRGKETASYKVGYTVLSRLNLNVSELADEIVSLENKNELMQADIQEVKEDVEAIPELKNDILAITGNLGQIKASSIKNRISLWIDSVPEVPSYQIRVTSDGSPVNDFNIYKAASDRTGLEIIYKDAGFDTWFTIERDDNKPVLYIYNARVTDGSGSAVEYTFDFRAVDSLAQDVEKLKSQDNSLSWKGISIVCFGDSLTEFLDYTNGKSYPDYIKDLTGAEVYNLGIGGSNFRQRSTPVNNPTNYKDAYAALDIVNMVKASCEQNFTKQIAAAKFLTTDQGDNNEAIVARMQNVDWSKVDVVTFFAGTNDWNNSNITSFGELTSTDINTTFGAIKEIIRLLLTTYPHIHIYWFSPTVRWLTDDNGVRTDATWSDVFERFGYTLEGFSDAILSVVKQFHLPMCDMYNTLGWNQYNFSQFFSDTDGVHPRVGEGTIQIAKKIIAFINSNKTF